MHPRPSLKKLLFVVAEVSYFKSHRLSLALFAQQHGYQVALASQCKKQFKKDEKYLKSLGIEVFHVPFHRASLNPLKDLWTLWRLVRVYKAFEPDIVHHVALKPILYGTIAARITKIPDIIQAISGFGVVFANTSWILSLLKFPLKKALTWAFSKGHVIIQNKDDAREVATWLKSDNACIHLIPGAGVDTTIFHPAEILCKDPVITFVGRLLWSKGVRELVEAAKILHKKGVRFRLNIVGESDTQNPDRVPHAWILRQKKYDFIHFLGVQENIQHIYQQSRIAILPSYREGIPKSLIEACACGLPIITTNVEGCRDVVTHGENGFIIPVKNAHALAHAMENLLSNADLCTHFGEASRTRALTDFEEQYIFQKHGDVWAI